jgi:hypothetical protein
VAALYLLSGWFVSDKRLQGFRLVAGNHDQFVKFA